MLCCITMLAPYTSYGKSYTVRLKKSLVTAPLVDPYIFDPSHKVLILDELWQMDVTHCPKLSPSSFLHVCIDTNSSFIWATPLRVEAMQHVITHLLACFAVMGTPSSIKTDNGPAYISRHFKQFLPSFSIKHITGIPYNPQTQDIVKQTHHTLSYK